MTGVGPGRKAGYHVELSEKAADDLVGVGFGAEAIELRHHLGEGALGVGNGAVGIELALLLETAFALREFFTVEIRDGMENGIALRA